ncbi:hypothetical protein MJG53_004080 [Ovis ammon polii x Ovis aries]|uniref:Uncharacterized protein n=1 Tax=Ovis ammon polii x Ovis aries TaxID=2918886 RepID=A0ACB9V8Z9_9CETA|nr:hypothetical protein MJG53_004080 [Ovis ammon polii x Ovis aries]
MESAVGKQTPLSGSVLLTLGITLHALPRRKPISRVKVADSSAWWTEVVPAPGEWRSWTRAPGAPCDDRWDLDDAHVVCRQLGCGKALQATVSSSFGAGSGPIWLGNVKCTGKESHVWRCPSWGWGKHDCDHSEDAGVICSVYTDVRLVTNSSSQCEGQVEMNISGRWRALCASHWSLANANVVCRQLGCGVAISTPNGAEGSDQLWKARFHCSGTESFLWKCPVTALGVPDCSHGNTASVICSGNQTQVLPQCDHFVSEPAGSAASEESAPYCSDSRQLRLVDGGGPCAGRVEILAQGSWGTICDDGWDLDDARVVCRQLGCGEALNATGSAHFGAGSGPIWLDDLNCTGNESHVWRCPSQGWGRHDCRHKEDAGVICSEFQALRMVSEDQQCAGWLEVFYSGTWGSVCRSPMDDVTVSIICRQLGCGDSGSVNTSVGLREGSRPRKKTQELSSCCPLHREKLRLRGGDSECSGRVEVWHSGSWGTVCDDSWSLAEAEVVCQQLGCGRALEAVRAATFGPGNGSIWLDEVRCKDNIAHDNSSYEDALAEAVYEELDYLLTQKEGLGSPVPCLLLEPPDQRTDVPAENYDDAEEVPVPGTPPASQGSEEEVPPEKHDGVRSSQTVLELRLKDGAHRCEGRVEVKHQGEWGTVDDLDWSLKDASVACRQLGCGAAIGFPGGAYFGPGLGPIWLLYTTCEGVESTVSDCRHSNIKDYRNDSYSHDWDAGVVCSGFVHLAGADGPCSGRVEVYSGEAWIPVSDGNFTLPTAQVICAELGCGKAVSVQGHELFRESDGQVWAEEFRCEGEEPELWVCPRVPCPGGTCHHSGAAQVVCSAYSEVRLMTNGSSQCEGQVEMNISGQWRALCASPWTLANANVVCRQLGCGVAISISGGPHVVEGGDQILTARFHCSGAESFLWNCPVTALGGPDCSHGNTASVICSGNQTQVLPQCNDSMAEPAGSAASEESAPYCSDSRQLRLMDGGGPCAGRVEILAQGSWGTICDDGWDLEDARVVCRQLGCGDALNATGSAHFGAGSGPIWLDDLNCTGKESHVWRCPSRGWGRHDCRHKQDAGVICSEFLALRLVSEDQQCAGWLEVFYNGTWGSVCRSPMEDITVSMICRQLGCGDSGTLNSSVGLREGSRPQWVDGIQCRKTDTSLWQCPSDPWNYTSCSPKEEAYISCAGSRQLRLVDGGGPCAGRVEILDQGSWGTICDDGWDLDDARVVCRQLGCGKALHATVSSSFGAGSGPIWLDNVKCTGKESHVWRCPSRGWGKHYCDHSLDAGVICSGFVRLAGKDGPCSGRVEVHSGEAWIPVSDGNFTLPTAQVICAELGCGKAVSVLEQVPFGESDGQVWAEEFRCEGEEPELWVCPRVPCPGGICHHSGAVQVVCSVYTDVRLVTNGSSQCEGQVEMNISGRWRALCASHWSLANANVVCRQLGCGVAVSTPNGAEGSDQLWKARFHCSGAESFLWKCPVTLLGGPDCSHGNTASVICSGNQTQMLPQCDHFVSEPAGSAASEESPPYCSDSRQLRLVDGAGPCAGRVEILAQGSWGTICDDGWDLDDARVVCRQLGCGEALNATGSAHFGAGSGPIWLDDLNCAGNESHVWRCPSRGWGQHDCRHKEDAGVICSEFLALRMVSEDQQCAGWLEVFYNGTWGSVCRSPMDDVTVSIICSQLGCGDSGSVNTSVGLREGSRPRKKTQELSSCCPLHREKLRLRGGDSECSGRVEVWHSGSWGTVCDDSWSLAEAEVVCQQLGCGQALEAMRAATFGPGNGSIWLDEVRCKDNIAHDYSSYEDALAEAVYEELDYLLTQKEGLGSPDERTDVPAENYDDVEEVPVPGTLPASQGSKEEVPPEKDDGVRSSQTVLELRLKDGAHRCEGRVEVKHQGEWGTVADGSWSLKDASVACRQLGCGVAIGIPKQAYFGPGVGPIWLSYTSCEGVESTVSDCRHSNIKDYRNDSYIHDWDAGVVCSGFVRLAGGDGPCSGRVEVYSGEAWIPVSDGNFTLPTAQVICAELGCGKAVSVQGHELFRESDAYSEVRLMTNGSSQCEGQVEMNISGQWRALCASPWSMANANVVCHQLGCGVAISTPGGPLLVERGDQILTARFHFSGAEYFLWSCPVTALGGPDCSHGNTASVICSGNLTQVLPPCNDSMAEPAGSAASVESTPYCSDSRQLRLVDGGGPCAGRVEILDQGSWGTICDDGWDLDDARVVCRQLGCGEALNATGSAHFGAGSGPIWLDYLNCTGKESHVWRCPSRGWGQHDCRHKQDAGVICSEFLALRMVSEDQQCAGWLEVFYNGTWGSVCRSPMEDITVSMICRQLGCGDSGTLNSSVGLREGSRPRWVDGIRCRKTDTSLWQCPSDPWNYTSCSPKEEAYISCEGSRKLRLADGSGPCSGRVEILDQGSWGTICGYNWDLDDARVVCRQLGCGKALEDTLSSSFGAGSGPIWLGNVKCTGNESHVWRCPSWGWGKHDCDHSQDAGVVCSGFVRLAGGAGPCSGRVEVHSGEAWIPVSDGNFTLPTAQVICAELGCGKAVSVLGQVPFRESDGQVWAEEFRCEGEEPELRVCPRVPCPWGTCHHSGAAQVVCSVYTDVRLVTNGSSQCEGQVEMNISGQWRALCASHWSLANANVVCRQLGCGVAISTPNGAEGSDQLWKARFHCSGTESFLWKCPVTALGDPDCSHGNRASVICSGNQTQVLPQCDHFVSEPAGSAASEESAPYCSDSRQLRLVDGGGPCAGRVEILDQGSWGTICDDGWDLDDARVVCRQLGCGEALNAMGSAHFGAGSGPIWLDDLNCAGNESHVWRCPSRGWGRHDCRHKEDAGVICSEFLALRMVSEDQQCAGWLEVFYNGTWGSVCRSPMDDVTVSIICRQLGCGDSGSLNTSVGLREGSRPQWVDLIQCRKTDTSLWQCPSGPWKFSSCSPKEEAYISCADREKLRLRGGDSECSGRVEVWHSGSWGTVCDDSWSLAEAEVVCQQLGCGQALETVRSAAFGPGNGSIWLDEVRCAGWESSLWDCAAEPWGQSDCKHEEDAGVKCSGVRTTLPPTTAGTRTTSNSLPGIFSLPGVLCLILGALLFLVLVILATQLLRWRAEHRALSSYEDALAEAVYEELDYVLTQKEGLGSPDQRTDVPAENYDDAEEVPVPGTPPASQGSEEEVPPEKGNGVRSSQTGSCLNFSREAADPGEGEESLWLLQGKKGDAGLDIQDINPIRAAGLEEDIVSYHSEFPKELYKLTSFAPFLTLFGNISPSLVYDFVYVDGRQLRLMDGAGPCPGRAEILHQGSWGTICDDGWDLDDARVVCRQLGCGEALSAVESAPFGAGSGPIWLDHVYCGRMESHVWQCPSRGWGRHNCSHDEDAGVIRSGFVHLVGKDGPCSGRVKVYSAEAWIPVSDGNFTLPTAQVICAELGCGKAVSVLGHVPFRESDGRVWAEEFRCEGEEPKLWSCPRVPCPGDTCHHSGAVQLVCSGNQTQVLPQCNDSVSQPAGSEASEESAPYCSDNRQLRLVDGGGPCAGRVEILDQGSWGTICDDGWDLDDARVVCRQLGCGEALNATGSAHFGAGSGPIWLDDLNCAGNESHVWRCPSRGWGRHDCRHKEDAGVICSVFPGRAVSDGFHVKAGLSLQFPVVVQSGDPVDDLGCGDNGTLDTFVALREGSRPRKKTQELSSCCPLHREKLRLRGGDNECSGRVEVWHSGSWGTVCDDSWSLAEAEVVCQQLGCGQALEAVQAAAFGPGNGSIWLDEVQDNIAPDYSRCCDPSTVRGEYSDSDNLFYELSDISGEERA